MKKINGFDFDGTISIPGRGVYPGPGDVIITGRSFEEADVTEKYLKHVGIHDIKIYFNPLKFDEKTPETSGLHKADVIRSLLLDEIMIQNYFEDDPVQAEIIKENCPWVNVIMIVHDLVTKGNVRRDEFGNEL